MRATTCKLRDQRRAETARKAATVRAIARLLGMDEDQLVADVLIEEPADCLSSLRRGRRRRSRHNPGAEHA